MGFNRFSLPVMVVVMMMINAMLLSQGCLEEERIALLQIKTSFADHPNLVSPVLSWGKDALCCSWEGVTCSNSTTRRVVEIHLVNTAYWHSRMQPWYLNASIFLPFQELNVLDLSGNGIAGCVANEGFERLSRLAKLEVLYLDDNGFNSSILSSLKNFLSLKYLYLQFNHLQRSIDTKEFDSLSNLEVLWLAGNNIQEFVTLTGFEGSSRLNKLESLDLSFNNFNNSILSSLKGLSSLKYLKLDSNQLQGSINMKGSEGPLRFNKLESLNLGYNRINDSTLSFLKGLSSLRHLNLNNNQLDGSIDTKEIDSLSELEVLSLTGNKIHNFSKSRENTGFSNLSDLYLDDVTSVFILQSLSVFPNLKTLSLRDNDNLYGFGQGELPNLKFLEQLDLTNSSLVNYNFLQTVGKFTSLKSLFLPYSGLSGPIFAPHGLCELKHLQELDISHNNLNGSLPSCLSNLTDLQVLDISFNNFTGNISLSPIGSLASIQDLKLSDNHFEIPISLGPFFNLSKLKHLNGDRNEIYESTELVHNLIPRFQLQSLSLACNGSGGTFPKSLYYQHDLQFVDLSHIKMTGEFPSWLLQNNTKLEELYLVNNSLSGSFQLANHSFMSLSHLDISRNRIHNQIPTEIGACFPGLVFLNLSRNDFSGSIPSSINNMISLEILDLSNNGLSGNIPEQLVEGCLSLSVLMLSNNHLKGQLFWKKINLKYLTDLILRGNQLTGILPNSLSNCSALQSLDVSLNNLSGKIPRWIGYMSSLQYLDLSENNLFGSLPSSFCSSGMMTEVYLSKNKLEGSLIGALDGCLSLKRLYLSHNSLTGEIPLELGYLSNIMLLNLSHNSLTGPIPPTFSNLKEIEGLDLSYNNLNGEIPRQLLDLNFLSAFSVAHNNLSGKTPEIVAQFATFDESSYEGNPLLCGPPLTNICSGESSPLSTYGFMDMQAFYVTFSVAYIMNLLTIGAVLYINPHWRRAWFYFIRESINNCYYFLVDNLHAPARFRRFQPCV